MVKALGLMVTENEWQKGQKLGPGPSASSSGRRGTALVLPPPSLEAGLQQGGVRQYSHVWVPCSLHPVDALYVLD